MEYIRLERKCKLKIGIFNFRYIFLVFKFIREKIASELE
jgi:hypothetical protein